MIKANRIIMGVALSAVKVLGMSGVGQIEGIGPEWSAPMVGVAIVGAGAVAWLLTEAICRLVGRREVSQGLGIIACAIVGLVAVVVPLVVDDCEIASQSTSPASHSLLK